MDGLGNESGRGAVVFAARCLTPLGQVSDR